MLKQTTNKQFYNQVVTSLYQQWTDSLRHLKEITDPHIQKLWVEDLKGLYSQFQDLKDNPYLNATQQSQVKIVLSREFESWVVFTKTITKSLS